jgi:TetR/AcrR family transcriptional regulator, regulator of autoinduction and epiphytic fitness
VPRPAQTPQTAGTTPGSSPSPVHATPAAIPPDGRSQRRDRNRAAVIDALLGLYREGVLNPGADEIAARAGISARSVFRYFDDREAMARSAIVRQQEHLAPLFELDATPAMPLPERVESFVASRVRLLEGMGEVGRIARARALRQPVLLTELGRIRRALRGQITQLFAAELDALPPSRRAAMVAAADVLTSWEGYDLMRNDQGLGHDEAAAAIVTALLTLLDPASGRDR